MDDNSIMPKWSAHKGEKLANVPDHYLRWLYENGKAHGELKKYIEENIDGIAANIKREDAKREDNTQS